MKLRVLDERIDARARATRGEHPWWPCGEGCDHCCRSLPHLPVITEPEWERIRPVLDDAAIARIRAASGTPLECPLLENARCTIYDVRPIACRTYGFYTERDAGLHCAKVTAATRDVDVVWGNGEAVQQDLDTLGERRSLAEWLMR